MCGMFFDPVFTFLKGFFLPSLVLGLWNFCLNISSLSGVFFSPITLACSLVFRPLFFWSFWVYARCFSILPLGFALNFPPSLVGARLVLSENSPSCSFSPLLPNAPPFKTNASGDRHIALLSLVLHYVFSTFSFFPLPPLFYDFPLACPSSLFSPHL